MTKRTRTARTTTPKKTTAAKQSVTDKMNEAVAEVKSVVTEPEKRDEVRQEIKTAVKKAEAKVEARAEARVEETKKAVKTTATQAAAKVTAVKDELHTEVYVQYNNQEALTKDIVAKAKAAYVAEGHKLSAIKNIQVYIKPEDNAAYYVVNGNSAGRIELF